MDLPQSLVTNLKQFENHTIKKICIYPERLTYAGGETIIFRFPNEGFIDLKTLKMSGIWKVERYNATYYDDLNPNSTLLVKSPNYISEIFSRMDLMIGGNSTGLASINDYGFVYRLMKTYKTSRQENKIMNEIFSTGTLSTGTMTINQTSSSQPFMIPDFLGLLSAEKTRYLPLTLLPNVVLQILTHDVSRWYSEITQVDNTAPGYGTVDLLQRILLTDVKITYDLLEFENDFVLNLYRQRLIQAPIMLPFTNYSMATTYPYTSRLFYQTQVNTNSLNYIYFTNRGLGFNTSGNDVKFLARYCGNNQKIKLSINNVPVSSSPFEDEDIAKMLSVVFGSQASVNNPENNQALTLDTFKNRDFILPYRVQLLSVEDDYNNNFITGRSTLGGYANITLDLVSNNTNNVIYGVLILETTGILQIYLGKETAFIP